MDSNQSGLSVKPGKIIVTDERLIPVLGTLKSCGLDVKADVKSFTQGKHSMIKLSPRQPMCMPTGLYFSFSEKLNIFVCSKSGLAMKKMLWAGLSKTNKYNPNYDELNIQILNISDQDIDIEHGDIIAQVVIIREGEEIHKPVQYLYTACKTYIKGQTQLPVPVTIQDNKEQLKDSFSEQFEGGQIVKIHEYTNFHILPGIIDCDFQGQLRVLCLNEIQGPITFEENTAIAKLHKFSPINFKNYFDIALVHRKKAEDSTNISNSLFLESFRQLHKKLDICIVREDRGDLGFGSTDKNIQSQSFNLFESRTLVNNTNTLLLSQLFSKIQIVIDI